MALVTIDNSIFSGIAAAIRAKLGVSTTYKPGDMAAAIASISGGGGGGGSSNFFEGDFTPADSDYVESGFVAVSYPSGKTSSDVLTLSVFEKNYASRLDRYSPVSWVFTNSPYKTRHMYSYRSSATTASSISTGSYNSVWNNPNYDLDATTGYQAVYSETNRIKFKTYGNYRFRSGVTYHYVIQFK